MTKLEDNLLKRITGFWFEISRFRCDKNQR